MLNKFAISICLFTQSLTFAFPPAPPPPPPNPVAELLARLTAPITATVQGATSILPIAISSEPWLGLHSAFRTPPRLLPLRQVELLPAPLMVSQEKRSLSDEVDGYEFEAEPPPKLPRFNFLPNFSPTSATTGELFRTELSLEWIKQALPRPSPIPATLMALPSDVVRNVLLRFLDSSSRNRLRETSSHLRNLIDGARRTGLTDTLPMVRKTVFEVPGTSDRARYLTHFQTGDLRTRIVGTCNDSSNIYLLTEFGDLFNYIPQTDELTVFASIGFVSQNETQLVLSPQSLYVFDETERLETGHRSLRIRAINRLTAQVRVLGIFEFGEDRGTRASGRFVFSVREGENEAYRLIRVDIETDEVSSIDVEGKFRGIFTHPNGVYIVTNVRILDFDNQTGEARTSIIKKLSMPSSITLSGSHVFQHVRTQANPGVRILTLEGQTVTTVPIRGYQPDTRLLSNEEIVCAFYKSRLHPRGRANLGIKACANLINFNHNEWNNRAIELPELFIENEVRVEGRLIIWYGTRLTDATRLITIIDTVSGKIYKRTLNFVVTKIVRLGGFLYCFGSIDTYTVFSIVRRFLRIAIIDLRGHL